MIINLLRKKNPKCMLHSHMGYHQNEYKEIFFLCVFSFGGQINKNLKNVSIYD